MALMQYVEDDNPDLTMHFAEISEVKKKHHVMWGDGRMLEAEGFTKVMLQQLKQPVTYQTQGCLVNPLGRSYKPDDAVVTGCTRRMGSWHYTCIDTLTTEFPHYELCQSFALFARGCQQKHAPASDSVDLRRVAQCSGTCPMRLQKQIELYRPGALQFDKAGMSTVEAWTKSIFRRTREKRPSCAIVAGMCVVRSVAESALIGVKADSVSRDGRPAFNPSAK